jgi:Holliday junction resolvasome RuvABC endonuclease subunit
MSFAGFDLGARCGYAILDYNGNRIESGTWDLGKRSPKSLFLFQEKLHTLFTRHDIVVAGYEKVTFMARGRSGFLAVQAWGGYEATLLIEIYKHQCEMTQVAVGTIKKVATGSGRAEKDEVEAAAYTRWVYVPEDDNESDALWIAECARLRFSGEIK